MSHAEHEHPNPNLVDDPHTSPLVLGAILGVLLVIVSVYATMALYYRSMDTVVKQRVYDPAEVSVAELHAQQVAGMSRYRWTDAARDRVGIPIEQAIELTAKELAATK